MSTATTEGPDSHKAVHDLARSPTRTDTTVAANLPESRRYRVKRVLLGPPLVSDDLHGQRLGKPTALAVLSSDVMSSSAYATEEMLRILVPIAGLAAFSIVTPMTAAILGVLAVVTICYRDVVRSYPKAGGSYVVSRDNFGPNVAQVAGAALLDQLHHHRRRVRRGGCRRDRLGRAGSRNPVVGPGCDERRLRDDPGLWQPARHPGSGPGLRHPDLLLHLQHGRAHCAGTGARGVGKPPAPAGAPGHPPARDTPVVASSSVCPPSSCCVPSPTAARP